MAIYFGTRSIAARLGYRSPQSVINRHEKRNEINPLPMYPRIKGRNWVWCSSEPLLQLWEVREANLSRNLRIARLKLPRRKHRKKQQDGSQNGHKEWTTSAFSEEKEKRPPHETGLPVPQVRAKSLPTRMADQHFARRMRSGRGIKR